MSRRMKMILGIIALAIVGFLVIQILPLGNVIPTLQFPGNPAVEQQIQFGTYPRPSS